MVRLYHFNSLLVLYLKQDFPILIHSKHVYPYCSCCVVDQNVIAHILLLLPKISLGGCWLGRLNSGGKKWRGSDVLVFWTNLRMISKPALQYALARYVTPYAPFYLVLTIGWEFLPFYIIYIFPPDLVKLDTTLNFDIIRYTNHF